MTKSSRSVFHLWQGFSVSAAIVGTLVVVLVLWVLIRYGRRNDNIPKQTQYHLPIESFYILAPILIIIGLFAATMVVENKEVSDPKTNVTVNVNAFQWGWKFTYPGTHALVIGQTTQAPTMVIPVNTNVHINLTSTDVIHGFYVSEFNFSRFALPGVLNQFTINAEKTGTYFGQCTQLCGLYHALMFFNVKVVTMPQYTAWLAKTSNADAASAASTATNQQTNTGVPTKPAKSEGDN